MASKQPTEPAWLAAPSGTCCIEGHIHSGKPRGAFEWNAEVETYVSHPPEGKANGNVLLYYPDVFGLFTNGLLIMDEFADAGYLVVGIDYFQGDPLYLHRTDLQTTKPGFDFEAWLDKYNKIAARIVPPWVAAIKQKYGTPSTKYACVGYCFGAPHVMKSLTNGDCSVGSFAHPAFLTEQHFQEIKAPLLLSCAEEDMTFPTAQLNRAVDILRERKHRYQVQIFGGVKHGFALRCDLENEYEVWVKESALVGMVRFFDHHLKEGGKEGKGEKL